MKRGLILAIILCLMSSIPAGAAITGITVSSKTSDGNTELRYYAGDTSFLGDSTNVTKGLFSSLAAGDFDGDGVEEVVAARTGINTCGTVDGAFVPESDLYYYSFGGSNHYFETRNSCKDFSAIATGNFDQDPESEVAVTVIWDYLQKLQHPDFMDAATCTAQGIPLYDCFALFETEVWFFQPQDSSDPAVGQRPYQDSRNEEGRFMAITTGNLDGDDQDELVLVKREEDGVLGQLESEIFTVESDAGQISTLLVNDSTPNQFHTYTDVVLGNFERDGDPANIVVTSDCSPGSGLGLNGPNGDCPDNGFFQAWYGETATLGGAPSGSEFHRFDSAPATGAAMTGIAKADLDGVGLDDLAVIMNSDMGYVAIYHGDGISADAFTVEIMAGPVDSRAVAVDTGDLDGDGLDEIVVLYDLQDGTSQVVTYDVDANFRLSVLNTGVPFAGNGLDLIVLEEVDCADPQMFYEDADGDGYGNPGAAVSSCEFEVDGYVMDNTDCDDTFAGAAINPGAEEICDNIDNDCDGTVDNWFDVDRDTYSSCGGDCDDTDFNINPGATETCNGVDDNCDGTIDLNPAITGITVSSKTSDGNTELRYYAGDTSFLGDSTNVTKGLFSSLAAGDFDGDGVEEVVAARTGINTCGTVDGAFVPESDLYYYSFGGSNHYFETRNSCKDFSAIATGNFDQDPESEVAVTVIWDYLQKLQHPDFMDAATCTAQGIPLYDCFALFETEVWFFQPQDSSDPAVGQRPYQDSRNEEGRFMAITTGNLDGDDQDELVLVKREEDGVLGQLESEIFTVESDAGQISTLLVNDSTPNQFHTYTDVVLGNFERDGDPANIVVTSDCSPGSGLGLNGPNGDCPDNGFFQAWYGETATLGGAPSGSEFHRFDSAPATSAAMTGIAKADLDGVGLDDLAVIMNSDMGYVAIYHGDGISADAFTVEIMAGPVDSRAVAVDTGDLDGDGLDEIVVLYDLQDGTSQVVTYDVDANFRLSVLNTGVPFNGTGLDLVILKGLYGLKQSTNCGLGNCLGNTGEETCTDGQWGGDTCDSYAGAKAEICDGLDNDCDGAVDEGLTRSTGCGLGVCAGNSGQETCTDGQWGGDTCDPHAGAQAEIATIWTTIVMALLMKGAFAVLPPSVILSGTI